MFRIKRTMQSKIHIADGVANAKFFLKTCPDCIIILMRIVLLLHEI